MNVLIRYRINFSRVIQACASSLHTCLSSAVPEYSVPQLHYKDLLTYSYVITTYTYLVIFTFVGTVAATY